MAGKHTEGPWAPSNGGRSNYVASVTGLSTTGKVFNVAMLARPMRGDVDANARLIAAAPELLEFAEHVRALAFDFLNEGIRPNHHHMRDLAWEAEKIVSKATRATQPLPTMSEEEK